MKHPAYSQKHRMRCVGCYEEWHACKQSLVAWAAARGYTRLDDQHEWMLPKSVIRGKQPWPAAEGQVVSIFVERWVGMVILHSLTSGQEKVRALRYFARHWRARRAFEVAVGLTGEEVDQRIHTITELVKHAGAR